jgi:hypothetical protein
MDQVESLSQQAMLTNLTNSPGWQLVKKVGENILVETERLALDADDDKTLVALSREARGARKFFTAYLKSIESLKDTDKPFGKDDENFIPVVY